jgi:hypothetical protein
VTKDLLGQAHIAADMRGCLASDGAAGESSDLRDLRAWQSWVRGFGGGAMTYASGYVPRPVCGGGRPVRGVRTHPS